MLLKAFVIIVLVLVVTAADITLYGTSRCLMVLNPTGEKVVG
jgi:amino acid permease